MEGDGRREVGKGDALIQALPDHSTPWTDILVCLNIFVVKINK